MTRRITEARLRRVLNQMFDHAVVAYINSDRPGDLKANRRVSVNDCMAELARKGYLK